MSSKRAMKQAQKQAYAKHRSNITNSKFVNKKKNSFISKKGKTKYLIFIVFFSKKYSN